MFDIGWSELLLIGIVALIVIGPKELPGALRTLGQWMGKLRRMAGEFQGQFQEAMREAELADLKKQVDDMTTQAQSYANFDPVGEVRKEFESTQQQIESAITHTPLAETPALPAAAEGAPATAAIGAEPAVAPTAGAPGADAHVAPPSGAPAEPATADGGAAVQHVQHDAGGKPA
jgi:sec-independent protein translocase protein TatB